jgi:opacity protein-like surface antigen
MRIKLFLLPLVATLLLIASHSALSQTIPAASENYPPYVLGVAFSNYDLGYNSSKYIIPYGSGRMSGGTLWAELYPFTVSSKLHGLGLAVEARDLSLSHSSSSFLTREDTAAGGLIYRSSQFHTLRPYAKATYGLGSVDFQSSNPYYTHDTRALWGIGGGLDYHAVRHVWIRADYEYQTWARLFFATLHPQGVTVGAIYDFGRWSRPSY